ncbi:MAG: hypothetical protein ACD_55C00093G0003, partial [uncultured bacterium]
MEAPFLPISGACEPGKVAAHLPVVNGAVSFWVQRKPCRC